MSNLTSPKGFDEWLEAFLNVPANPEAMFNKYTLNLLKTAWLNAENYHKSDLAALKKAGDGMKLTGKDFEKALHRAQHHYLGRDHCEGCRSISDWKLALKAWEEARGSE